MKRLEASDPVMMCREGWEQYEKGDYNKAFEYLSKAAELGNARAHYQLARMYHYGEGIQEDKGKEIHHGRGSYCR